MIKRLILGLLVVVLIVLFTLNNTAPTKLNIIGFSITVPLALLLVISLATGAAIAILFLVSPALKERKTLTRYRRQVSDLTGELETLKRRQSLGSVDQVPEVPGRFPPEMDEG